MTFGHGKVKGLLREVGKRRYSELKSTLLTKGESDTKTLTGHPPRSHMHAGSDELSRLRDENGQLREVFATATPEFARLRGQVRSLEDELVRERRRADSFEAQCGRLEKKLEKSEARANKFASMLFAIKSEKLKVSDIEAGNDAVAVESAAEKVVREGTGAGPAEEQQATPDKEKEKEKKRRGARQGHPGSGRKIPKDLPVEETRVEIPAETLICPVCGQPGIEKPGLEKVSYQVTVKKQYLLRRIARLTYGPACSCGKLPKLITAPPPDQLIPKGKFSEEFWVDILVSKFMSHLPVNRQLFEMVQAGVGIRAGAVFGGLRKIALDYLEPLHEALILDLRLARHWHADETRWRMFLDECKTLWYMWAYRSANIVVFVLDPTRAAAVPLKTLFDLDAEEIGANGLQLETVPVETALEQKKIMTVDRYSAYKVLMRYGLVLLAYCWAHVRRDFIDITKKYPGNLPLCRWAEAWVLKIANLYQINHKRVEHPNGSKLFLEYDTMLRAALQEMRKDIGGKHDHDAQVKAMDSMRRHWDGLTLFVQHPELPMDNNLMENGIRPCALGRNNFLGNHSRWGGDLAACMYSIIQTCLLNDIDPRAYLTYYFRECMARKEMDAETAGKLLPHKISGRLKDKLRLKKK